jgi:hypothetical protein
VVFFGDIVNQVLLRPWAWAGRLGWRSVALRRGLCGAARVRSWVRSVCVIGSKVPMGAMGWRRERDLLAAGLVATDPCWMGPVRGLSCVNAMGFEQEKGIWWMPWRQEAKKDVARCENLGGAASRR